jgi:hypothetical protein
LFLSFLLQLINYLTCSTMFLVPNIDQMYKEMKKIQTGNRFLINPFQLNAYQKASISQQSSVYCWSRKQTRKRRRISGFCRSIIFLGIKNVRVGGKILGSVGRSETHIYFWPSLLHLCLKKMFCLLNLYDIEVLLIRNSMQVIWSSQTPDWVSNWRISLFCGETAPTCDLILIWFFFCFFFLGGGGVFVHYLNTVESKLAWYWMER